jgi:hypothetical protein
MPSTSPSKRSRDQCGAEALAATLLSPETQVAFNLKKGSLPIRGDVDLAAANDCMKKGLEILAGGNTMPDVNMLNPRTPTTRLNDLMVEFFNDASTWPRSRAGTLGRDRREQGLTVLLPTAGPHHARAGGSRPPVRTAQDAPMASGRPFSLSATVTPLIAAIPMILTAVCVFVGGTIWTVVYSFTDSRLLPRLNFVGLDQYERLWGTNRWLVVDREPDDLRRDARSSSPFVIGFLLAVLMDQKIRFENTFRTIMLYPFALSSS